MQERRATGVSVAQVARELDVRAEPSQAVAVVGEEVRLAQPSCACQANRWIKKCARCVARMKSCARNKPSHTSGGVLREVVAMKQAVIIRHRDDFAVRLMCHVLDVTPSDPHAFLKSLESWRAVIDDVLMAHVRVSHAESKNTCGAPRVHEELTAQGSPTSRKRVARLMRENGHVDRSPVKGWIDGSLHVWSTYGRIASYMGGTMAVTRQATLGAPVPSASVITGHAQGTWPAESGASEYVVQVEDVDRSRDPIWGCCYRYRGVQSVTIMDTTI